jgi:hypothetical protein
MPKYCVEELEGALLDAAVAKAEGHHGRLVDLAAEGKPDWLFDGPDYSRAWEHGGPIIERERIHLVAWPTAEWGASVDPRIGMTTNGKTPLIAAMRAYVASKFGREVELP